jgi:hypothetical protein
MSLTRMTRSGSGRNSILSTSNVAMNCNSSIAHIAGIRRMTKTLSQSISELVNSNASGLLAVPKAT